MNTHTTQPLQPIQNADLVTGQTTLPNQPDQASKEGHTATPPQEDQDFTLSPTSNKLPTGVSWNVIQAVLIVSDHSSSMCGKKIEELNQARMAFVGEVAVPANKGGFRVGEIPFNHEAYMTTPFAKADEIQLPHLTASGGTNFEDALALAYSEIVKFQNLPNPKGLHFLRTQVLFLSDGQDRATPETIAALKEIADVTSIAYGSDADQTMLAKISSDGQVHSVGTRGGELRAFLSQVGRTMTEEFAKQA